MSAAPARTAEEEAAESFPRAVTAGATRSAAHLGRLDERLVAGAV